MTVTIEAGGIVVHWLAADMTMLFGDGNCWLAYAGRFLISVPIGLA